MHTLEAPDFWGLPKNKNCTFPLTSFFIIEKLKRLFIAITLLKLIFFSLIGVLKSEEKKLALTSFCLSQET